jgi:formate dehydrogenase subunit delta
MDGHDAHEPKLVHMANQIAAFFHSYPDQEARAGIARHLADFWTPHMRAELRAIIDQGGTGLDPLVVRTVTDASG